MPKNLLITQDVRTWVTVVHHTVLKSVGDLVDQLGRDKAALNRGSQGFLEIW